MRCALLLLTAACLLRADAPKFEDAASLESFLFPTDREKITDSMNAVFRMDHAGNLVTIATKFGPAVASKTVSAVSEPVFKDAYRDLARYLDQFGPCLKKQQPDANDWFANYPADATDQYCREITKMLAANLLWSQVHYCRQLVRGDVQPKIPASQYGPRPWTLDLPPVKSPWMYSDVLYAMADAGVAPGFRDVLGKQLKAAPPELKGLREAIEESVKEIASDHPSRELVALALAKILVRSYEAVHIGHLAHIQAGQTVSK